MKHVETIAALQSHHQPVRKLLEQKDGSTPSWTGTNDTRELVLHLDKQLMDLSLHSVQGW